MKLEISSLFKQDNVHLDNLDAPITVANISRHGLGFKSPADLPLNYYFNAIMVIGAEDAKLYTVVKIIRKDPANEEGLFGYGCELIGVAPVFDYLFDDYEKSLE